MIVNNGASPLTVYPLASGAINALAVNIGHIVPAGTGCQYVTLDGLSWTSSPYSTSVPLMTSQPVISVTATTTLTADQSNSLINVASSAAAITLSLPASALCVGKTFKFIVTGALSNIVTIQADGAYIKGPVVPMNVTAVVGPGATASTNILLN